MPCWTNGCHPRFAADWIDRSPSHAQDESRVELDRRLARRHRWKLTTAPKITNGATATATTNSGNGFGEISARTIQLAIQRVAKATAKSNFGTRFQYRTARMAIAGAIVAPIM